MDGDPSAGPLLTGSRQQCWAHVALTGRQLAQVQARVCASQMNALPPAPPQDGQLTRFLPHARLCWKVYQEVPSLEHKHLNSGSQRPTVPSFPP